MSWLHREHGAHCAEQHESGPAAAPAARMDRLVQARANRAIQRKGRDLPRGEVRVQRIQGDDGVLLGQLNIVGFGLALQAGAAPPDFDEWGWNREIGDNIEAGLVSRQDVELYHTVRHGLATSSWSAKVDFKIEGEHEVGKGKGESEYSRATGRKSSRSRGSSTSRTQGTGMKLGASSGHEQSMSGESGMDVGLEVKGVGKLGASNKQGFGAKETSGSTSELSASSESTVGSSDSDASEDSDQEASTSRFRAEKTAVAARIVANVTLTLHHFDMTDGEGPIHKKRSFSVPAGMVRFIEDSNIAG